MKFKVRFLPDDIVVTVDRGTRVLDAAVNAGVDINSSCGGKGTCRKCRVAVGDLADPGSIPEALQLACQTYVDRDISVGVPEETRIRTHQILDTHRPHDIEDLSPLALWTEVELPEPSLVDNLGDLERLGRALDLEPADMQVPLEVLRLLPRLLRNESWRIEVVRRASDIGGSVIRICPAGRPRLGAAVDIGTTTVVLVLVDLLTGKTLATSSDYNRQARAGDDVISRIAYAEEGGLEELQDLILRTVNQLLGEAMSSIGSPISDEDICALSVAGNTTMVHLFLGLEPKFVRYSPYIAASNFPPVNKAKDLGMHICPNAPVYCVPGRASFVGGDIVSDVIASGLHDDEKLSLLMDVGTNGEVVLGNKDFMVACSCSAGPAFEGGEVEAGMRAMPGAIERASISRDLHLTYSTIGNVPPKGICGSGLIDIAAQMFLRGLLDKKGRLQPNGGAMIRSTDNGSEFVVVAKGEGVGKDIVLKDDDIANIVRTKAAMYAGCQVLLDGVDRTFEEVEKVYIAGGFGNYIDVENAVLIGLLPDIPRKRFEFLGNAALSGAVQALLSSVKRKEAIRVYEHMTYIELSTAQRFFDEFSSACFLPHTDISRFKSVASKLKAMHR